MKRFKVANGNNEKINLNLDVNNSTTKIASMPGWPPKRTPKPPKTPKPTIVEDLGTGATGYPRLPLDIPSGYANALDIIQGKKQLDEIKSIAKSKKLAYSGAAGFILNNFTKLPFSGSAGMSYLASQLVASQLVSMLANQLRPIIRRNLTLNSQKYLENFKKLESMQYNIKKFNYTVDAQGNETLLPIQGTEAMTLGQIANSIKGGNLYGDDAWRVNNVVYSFEKQDDVNNINHMFKTNLSDDERDAVMSNIMPWISGAGTVGLTSVYTFFRDRGRSGEGANPATGKPYAEKPEDKAGKEQALREREQMTGFKPTRSKNK
jgi:hypothetical protein